jgi:AcrR family transcriptional regulator
MSVRIRPTLLDIATDVLTADPTASLAEVAEAAGIGRTTLHKHYPTREDLLRAVGHRVIDLFDAAVEAVDDGPDGGLRDLIAAMVPIGSQLTFLWRNTFFDTEPAIDQRWIDTQQRAAAVLNRSRAHGVLDPQTPDWWLLETLYSLIYVAALSVGAGRLAPLDAPDLVLKTFLRGVRP